MQQPSRLVALPTELRLLIWEDILSEMTSTKNLWHPFLLTCATMHSDISSFLARQELTLHITITSLSQRRGLLLPKYANKPSLEDDDLDFLYPALATPASACKSLAKYCEQFKTVVLHVEINKFAKDWYRPRPLHFLVWLLRMQRMRNAAQKSLELEVPFDPTSATEDRREDEVNICAILVRGLRKFFVRSTSQLLPTTAFSWELLETDDVCNTVPGLALPEGPPEFLQRQGTLDSLDLFAQTLAFEADRKARWRCKWYQWRASRFEGIIEKLQGPLCS